jgi:hypothetical protein
MSRRARIVNNTHGTVHKPHFRVVLKYQDGAPEPIQVTLGSL